ncbi:MAG: hypothetical protein KGJ84_12215 [Elusimicrobia bacterium]|nr:hypothetical protein [Elusimicrobiota bacterium]
MLERSILSAVLAGTLYFLLSPPEEHGRFRSVVTAFLLAALSWTMLSWTANVRLFPDAFPDQLSPLAAVGLQLAGTILGAAAFAVAGRRARLGAAFGLTVSALGWCASRWPVLSRAIEMNGGVFAGPFLAALLGAAFALTAAGVAAAILLEEVRPHAGKLILLAAVLWAVPTAGTEYALTRWWGLGPKSLAEAAGIPTNADAESAAEVRLVPSRGHAVARETARMADQGVSLTPETLTKLESFLKKAGYRDVFAAEALSDLRRGWLMWWETDRALDAMMLAAPGRAHPDYRGALDLIKVGPLTAERYDKLEELAAMAVPGSGGFEQVTASQYIFEDFAAAYARYDDEPKARFWLARLDSLMMVSEKKLEVAPLETFRTGRVSGSVQLDGRPAGSVLVGLFAIWRTTADAPGERLLSSSAFPDENGEFQFTDLGPGEYELGLLGRTDQLRGQILGSPGRFEVDEDTPAVTLPPIRIERDVLPVPEAFGPSRVPEAPTPEVPEPPLLWRKR